MRFLPFPHMEFTVGAVVSPPGRHVLMGWCRFYLALLLVVAAGIVAVPRLLPHVLAWSRPDVIFRRDSDRKVLYITIDDALAVPGGIVIMHDGDVRGRTTAKVLADVLPALKRAGYTLVSLDRIASSIGKPPAE